MATTKSMPEFEFCEGCLWITDALATMWLRAWPNPEANEKNHQGEWRPFRPEFRLVQPESPAELTAHDYDHRRLACDSTDGLDAPTAASKQAAYASLRKSLLPSHAALLEPFTGYQWNMLPLLHERPLFSDLLQANPVLAWCVANNDLFRKLSARSPAFQARWHLHKKQRELLDWLGFPGGEPAVKLFKKFTPALASPRPLHLLQAALADGAQSIRQLAHVPRINWGALYLATDPRLRDHVTPGLLTEVAAQPTEETESQLAGMMMDALNVQKQIDPWSPCQSLPSIAALVRFHDRIVFEFNNRPPGFVTPSAPYPPPPLRGNSSVVPVTTAADLRKEGREQGNCVAIFEAAVQAGHRYFYRVLKPERATLCIMPGNSGDWHISELRKKGNKAVKPVTWLHAYKWLQWAKADNERPTQC